MRIVLQRYATPFITGLFLVSLISGIALIFHIGPAGFHGLHEWLSMVLILPFALHLWKNWRPMLSYFRRAPMAVALVLSVLASLPFLTGGAQGGGRPPQFALARQVLSGSATELAPLLDTDPESLIAELGESGIIVRDPVQPLIEATVVAGKSETELAALLVGQGR